MCDLGQAIGRIFTPSGTGGLEAEEKAAADAALQAQQTAKAQADQAAAGSASSESARAASDARLRLLLAAGGTNAAFAGGPVALPSAAGKLLTGA